LETIRNAGVLRGVFPELVRPARLVCTAGARPAGVKVRSPVDKVATWKETEMLKPTDKAILRVVSE
jgi:hypothetical protein